ncbi:hypothetical protein ACFL96_08400 [Thermoproteota archaeon]
MAKHFELAIKLNHVRGEQKQVKYTKPGLIARIRGERPREIIPDSRYELEAMGFEILKQADRYMYSVKAPEGWKMEPTPGYDHGYFSSVYDDQGVERISQFRKLYDPLPPPLKFMESEEDRTEEAWLDILG